MNRPTLEELVRRLAQHKAKELAARDELRAYRVNMIQDQDPERSWESWCDGPLAGPVNTASESDTCYRLTDDRRRWCEKCVTSTEIRERMMAARRRARGVVRSLVHRGQQLLQAPGVSHV